jgi:hypothetical protein
MRTARRDHRISKAKGLQKKKSDPWEPLEGTTGVPGGDKQ